MTYIFLPDGLATILNQLALKYYPIKFCIVKNIYLYEFFPLFSSLLFLLLVVIVKLAKELWRNKFISNQNSDAYKVPATRVLMWVLSSSSSLAKPKSDILGFKCLSSSTFVALMSLCTIFNLDSSWRYAKPLAIPMQIFCLVGQSNFNCLSSGPFSKQIKNSSDI